VRIRALGLELYREYMDYLSRNKGEYDILLEMLTINVTQFWRDLPVFKLIESEILPLIIYEKVRAGRKVIRVWSAGSSSGEEAHSIGMILRDLLGEEFSKFIISIHGTDIDDDSLLVAKRGVYNIKQIENIPQDYRRKYLTMDSESARVSDEVRNMMKFTKRDLFQPQKTGHYDLILCRNVMIYFTKEQQATLLMNFFDALNNGGYFVMGKTETLIGPAREKFTSYSDLERIYQKTKGSAA